MLSHRPEPAEAGLHGAVTRLKPLASRAFVRSIALAIGLHYVLAPAESPGSSFAVDLRLVVAMMISLVVLAHTWREDAWQSVALPLTLLCAWILLLNFPSATWYALIFCVFVIASAAIAIGFTVARTRSLFLSALDALIVIWIVALLFQILAYYALGAVVDLHAFLHPYSQARLYEEGMYGLFRMTGLHIEPGTYSNWMFGIVFLRGLLRNRFFDGLSVLAVASLPLTVSFWGLLCAAVYFGAYALHLAGRKGAGRALPFAGLVILAGGIYSLVGSDLLQSATEYFLYRSELEDGSGYAKRSAYREFMSELWTVAAFGTPVDHDFCGGCEAPQDAGILINLIMRLGVAGTLLMLFPLAVATFRTGGAAGLLLLLPLAFAKFFYFEPILWIAVWYCWLAVPGTAGGGKPKGIAERRKR